MIGETGPADAERVYMAGAHLDSVREGPGMNDNGSGVAAVLEVAEQLASRPLAGGAALRVGFWGAEEIGLVGSDRYVRRLSAAERRRIRAYVNLDMVGSPGEPATRVPFSPAAWRSARRCSEMPAGSIEACGVAVGVGVTCASRSAAAWRAGSPPPASSSAATPATTTAPTAASHRPIAPIVARPGCGRAN